METCIRGFSYMPESKLDANLQYIEHGELERAWKVNRRQRLKDQEQRIWEDFVKEQDIVQKVYSEDPYQFLHELPENCLKELMEAELNKMKRDAKEDPVVEQLNKGEGDHPAEKQVVHSVTFAEDEKLDVDMFHIFDDETDLNQSGGEEEQADSPSTVRERRSDDAPPTEPPPQDPLQHPPGSDDLHNSDGTVAVKSTENVSNVIESSIYCARVKDIRLKLNEEMVAVMASLDIQDVMSVDRLEVSRRCRRAAEFCARFHRIYMYQLQRQAHNIKRHVSQSLPLAQHTQFQSQMLRVVSLHQNMLQALQMFHKSFPATSCLRECGRALSGVCAFVRDASALCRAVPAPRDFAAARDLYDDELLQTCDKLDGAITEYALRVADFLSSSDITTIDLKATPSSTRTKKSKRGLTYTKTGTKTGTKTWSTKDTDARLSMYSLDTLRINLHAKSSTSRGNQSNGTSKANASPSVVVVNKPHAAKAADRPTKRIIRRPLMRAPQSCAPRPRAPRHDLDITTMVEAVDTCESSHVMSQSLSPRSRDRTPRLDTPRQHVPRSPQHSPRISQKTSPRSKLRTASPKVNSRRASPKYITAKISPSTIRSETPNTMTTAKTPIAPVTKVQCAKKQPRNSEKSLERSGKSPDRSINNGKSPDQSGKSTERSRNSEKRTDRSGKSIDRSISGRGKEIDKIYGARGSFKGREYNRIGGKFDKNSNRGNDDNVRVNKDVVCSNEGSLDTDGSNGIVSKDAVYGKVDNDGSHDRDDGNGIGYKVARPGHIGNPGKEDNTGREFCGVKELTDNEDNYSRSYAREVDEERCEREKNWSTGHVSPARCDVTRLLRQLCSGDPAGLINEKVSGARNAQLLCIRGGSPPRQPSTPQLLRILEETIQKQSPRPIYVKPRNPERYRLNFNIPETIASRLFQYRTKFVQHMLTSPMYANSAVGKPWEMIGSVSDKIIDELLTSIAKEMEISHVLRELYKCETN